MRTLTPPIGALAIALVMGAAGSARPFAQAAPPQAASVDQLIDWLDDPERQWVATVRLQAAPDATVPLLLQGNGLEIRDSGYVSARRLALTKFGERALPAVRDRALAILRAHDSRPIGDAFPLLSVLGSMGPPAVPALVEIAGANPFAAFHALDEIVRLEPPTTTYGQQISPWQYWRPADDRLEALERVLVPLLPRVRQVMERAIKETPPESSAPQRPAAYLLARWGRGDLRARGHEVLVQTASGSRGFYNDLESIRLLHRLNAPETAALIRALAPRVGDIGGLKGSYLLHMAAALHQLHDAGYTDLLDAPLHDKRPEVRMEAARFLASTGDIAHVSRILPLLDDREEWGDKTVAAVALESLRQLTLTDLEADPAAWRAWLDSHSGIAPGELDTTLAASRIASIGQAPMDQATAWIQRLGPADDSTSLALIDAYLRRSELDASTISGGSGPPGMHGPAVVTRLLGMVQRGVPGAMERLELCLTAAGRDVRIFGALALAAYDPRRAADALASELDAPDTRKYSHAAEFLLQLGDPRGILPRIEALEAASESTRTLACQDLRMYSQQPLPCNAQAAWRAWWTERGGTFRIPLRQARLDLDAFPGITPVSIGGRPVQ